VEADCELKVVVQRENDEEYSECAVTPSSGSYGEPAPKKFRVDDLVPCNIKIEAVALAQLHPT
jgi:hypothetical protein